jgi:polysaccharide export outer membrane protein
MERETKIKTNALTLLACCVLLLGGCAWLPAAGPTAAGVVDQAADRYLIIPADDAVLDILARQPAPGFQALFGGGAAPPEPIIAVGDTILVSLWEAGGNTLFAPPATAGGPVSTGAQPVNIPEQTVLPDGAISIPFAGRIPLLGRRYAEAQELIRKSLVGKATDPQVILGVTRSAHQTVTVTGEAVAGSRVALSPMGERVLDVIAMAGGIKTPTFQTWVRLTRGGATGAVPLRTLVENPKDNIYVWPGDTLTVTARPRHFQAFGATGRNENFEFDDQDITLSQALARSAGLTDERADPQGVFLLRFEPRALAAQLAHRAMSQSADLVPVVYRFDFRNMQSYFLAQRFAMKDGDILYVANAQSNALRKFFQLFGTITAPVVTGAAVNNSVR